VQDGRKIVAAELVRIWDAAKARSSLTTGRTKMTRTIKIMTVRMHKSSKI